MESTKKQLPILSAFVLAIDCNGMAIFTNRSDGSGYEFPGGGPESVDKDWLATACREFHEEVEPNEWSLNDLTLIGKQTFPSKKKIGLYGLALYYSDIPFVDSLKDKVFRAVDCNKQTAEVNGILLAPWNELPQGIIPFQQQNFIPIFDQMLNRQFYFSEDPHLSQNGFYLVWQGIVSRHNVFI